MIDRQGNLQGLIFDGNIESLVGRYVYNIESNRAVSVHTAAMIEALKKLYDAGPLSELTGVKLQSGDVPQLLKLIAAVHKFGAATGRRTPNCSRERNFANQNGPVTMGSRGRHCPGHIRQAPPPAARSAARAMAPDLDIFIHSSMIRLSLGISPQLHSRSRLYTRWSSSHSTSISPDQEIPDL